MAVSSASCILLGQNTRVKPTRQSSMENFSKGNYEEAYNQFQELLYKYYSGVCLVKLNKNPEGAVAFLKQAIQSAGVVKSLPDDALFYLGRAQQMSGRFQDASGSYNQFIEQAGRKTSKELGVSEFIKQCNQKTGQISEADIVNVSDSLGDKTDSLKSETKPVLNEVAKKPDIVRTNQKIALPDTIDKSLKDGIGLQFKADSVNLVLQQQKGDMNKLPASEKQSMKVRVSENELLVDSLQKSADLKYSEAHAAINPKQMINRQPEPPVLTNKPVTRDSIPAQENESVKTLEQLPVSEVIKNTENQIDTVKKVIPPIQKKTEIFSYFDIVDKPVSDPKEKIIVDGEVPAGLIYRIQIAVFRNPVAISYFKGITPVYGFKIPGTDKTNYYAGMFRRAADANKALSKVKTRGFKDAFVIALSANKPVSADRAALIEKEWGQKPFVSFEKPDQQVQLDTIPPTLTFRVEVMKSLKPAKADVVDGIKKMAGSRGLDIQTLDDGNIAYLVGKFITFESAAEYADLLLRNGYREAKVVAFLGKREISVETAKQLFENLE
jgi:tetratricopeptide (TPR) repeat protein